MTVTDYRAAALQGQVIPVIDIGPWISGDPSGAQRVAREVDAARREIGFFLMIGHGIDPELVQRVRDVSATFFALPDSVKQRYGSPTGNTYRGWATRESDDEPPVRLRETLEACRYDTVADLAAAGYGQRWLDTFDPNIWPAEPADFQATWDAYAAAMRELGTTLLSICAAALGLDPGWFADKFDRETSYLSANQYPAVDDADINMRFGAHTDIGSLTILYRDEGRAGLQVFDRLGRWCDIQTVPDSFVVNLGDMLAKWTNDRWVATRHRVVQPVIDTGTGSGTEAQPAYSIPYFQHPNFDALVECIPTCVGPDNPAKYPPVLGGDWANHRFTTGDYSTLDYD
jgi:isopenicillin N synthase-like dioxygenase